MRIPSFSLGLPKPETLNLQQDQMSVCWWFAFCMYQTKHWNHVHSTCQDVRIHMLLLGLAHQAQPYFWWSFFWHAPKRPESPYFNASGRNLSFPLGLQHDHAFLLMICIWHVPISTPKSFYLDISARTYPLIFPWICFWLFADVLHSACTLIRPKSPHFNASARTYTLAFLLGLPQ